MFEYPKTENLFTRNEETHKLNMGDFRCPEFELIKYWHVTEKIDGTNMRVIYDTNTGMVDIRGRSDRANIHGDLFKNMQAEFPAEKMDAAFGPFLIDRPGTIVTLYGEGYGAGIQKGGGYSDTKKFRVFDIMYSYVQDDGTFLHSWCQPSTVEMICMQNEFPMVPVINGAATIEQVVSLVKSMNSVAEYFYSDTAWADSGNVELQPEGIIARTNPYLYTHRGSRVMFKLKTNDIPVESLIDN